MASKGIGGVVKLENYKVSHLDKLQSDVHQEGGDDSSEVE